MNGATESRRHGERREAKRSGARRPRPALSLRVGLPLHAGLAPSLVNA
jgi:hypothetical protein